MLKFKVGDRVYVDGYSTMNSRKQRVHVKGVGTISDTAAAPTIYFVTMDKPFGDTGTYFAAFERELSPLKATNPKDTKLVFYTKDNTVHCKLFSVKDLMSHTQATCSPDDTFDFLTGVQIALQRMLKEQNKELVLPALKTLNLLILIKRR